MNEERTDPADASVVRLRRTWSCLAATAVGAALAATAAPAGAGTAASASAAHYPHATRATATVGTAADPAVNVPPTPDYWLTCSRSGTGSQTCIDAVVSAIDHARALEGVGPMVLPSGFAALSSAVQTFVVSNLERVDRGLQPAAGMVSSLNALSATAANNDADPVLPSWNPIGGFSPNRWASNWAGDLNALAADYDWMYNDGWGPTGSYNLDCTTATATGCWGHRHNILATFSGEQVITGVASVVQSQWTSISQIFVAGSGSYPDFTDSWSQSTAPASTTATPSTSTSTTATQVDGTTIAAVAPSTIVAGRGATVSGRLSDTTAGVAIPGAAMRLCQRAVTTAASTCTSVTTNADGTAATVVRPQVSTVYWLTYDGSPVLASGASNQVVVHVRPALVLHARRRATGRSVTAHLTPAHGQAVILQRHTSRGWVTVRRVTAHTWMSFTRLRAGSYRVAVRAVTGSLRTVGYVRAS